MSAMDVDGEAPRHGSPPVAGSLSSASASTPWAIDQLTLRFRDGDVERSFRAHFGRHNVTNVRVGHVLGVVMWVVWGVMIRGYLGDERGFDLIVRYGVLIPMTLTGLALTFWSGFPRVWKAEAMAILLGTAFVWIGYVTQINRMPADFGYVGLILIQTFAFSIIRLPFGLVAIFDAVTVPAYLVLALSSASIAGVQATLAIFYLGSFGLLGLIASYVLEWKIRKLYVRERQLDRERDRSDSLLLNILPQAIIDRLKAQGEEGNKRRVADGLDDVTVLFADAVGFTVQAGKTTANDLVAALDDLFSRFDALADRYGLEKIKTVGDAYMAVAGAPEARPDHTEAAANMALAICRELRGARWPSGDPVLVRVGMASGPAVAGVIGERKFAYDLWGDTVNLASRLQSRAEPGGILASESVVAELPSRYEFGPAVVLDLKGKGPTQARSLLGREGAERPGILEVTSQPGDR
jgi:class 3 adenylate cyclase